MFEYVYSGGKFVWNYKLDIIISDVLSHLDNPNSHPDPQHYIPNLINHITSNN